ncbi:MAG: hypothetical protein HYV07_15045 [Deltaproteobacteria bacterium]|nr:hypothetical protein [Deltaproteobacteria bacterium]
MSNDVPPLVAFATTLLEPGPNGYALSKTASDKLFAALRSSFGAPELAENVKSLVLFAGFLETQKGSPEAADAIIELLKGARIAFEAAGLTVPDALSSNRRELRAKGLVLGPETKGAGPTPQGPTLKWWEAMKKDSSD